MHRCFLFLAIVLATMALDDGPLAAPATPLRIPLGGADTIAVSDTGTGPVVVLVPGLLGGAHSFRKVVPALVAAGHRVLVVQPLGTGDSSRPGNGDYSLETQAARVDAALQHLGVDSALFVCHSVAGSICYRLALRDAALVRGIVAINGGPDERAATSGLRFALRFAPLMRVFGGAGTARKRLREGLIEGSADPAWVTEEVLAAYTRPYDDMDSALRALRGMASAREPLPLAPRLAQLAVPVRLLVGAGSRKAATSEADIERLTRAVPDISVTRVEGAGQYIQEEKPEAIVEAVSLLRNAAERAHPGPSTSFSAAHFRARVLPKRS